MLLLEEIAPCWENIYDAYSALAIGYGSSSDSAMWSFTLLCMGTTSTSALIMAQPSTIR